jgi:transposase-like protein
MQTPKTLIEAIRYFGQPGVALAFAAKLRWPDGIFCGRCGEEDPMFLATVERWKCRGCGNQFSVKKGTIMEDSPIPLDKWLCAIWMIANCKNGVSSYEIARALGITQKSGWFLLHRIRHAMQLGTIAKLTGPVETDETYIGGKVKNMSKSRRKAHREASPNSTSEKAIVAGVLERGGHVRATIIPNTSGQVLQDHIRQNVEPGAKVFTDGNQGYIGIEKDYSRGAVNHAIEEYVRGEVHVNGIENFWALLKRGLHGTYVNVEPFHLVRYLDEQIFRYNTRKTNDAGRFVSMLSRLAGKRLTYKALINGLEPQTC